MDVTIRFPVRATAFVLLGVALTLVAFGVLADALLYMLDDPPGWVTPLHRQFNLTNERNIPTWYSSVLLVIAGIMAANVGVHHLRAGAKFALHWLVLAAIMTFLSADETAGLHERLISVTKSWVPQTGGLLRYSWVVPYLVGVAVLGVVYLRFLNHLPVRTRRLIVMSGVMYVGAAAGLEMLEGLWVTQTGTKGVGNIGTFLLTTTEESLEMIAIILFSYAVGDYAGRLPPPEAAADAVAAAAATPAQSGITANGH